MVKKRVAGKIQLWIGIILLIISVAGGGLTYIPYNNLKETYSPSVELITISMQLNIIIGFAVIFITSFILSLLFITQGLINISEEN